MLIKITFPEISMPISSRTLFTIPLVSSSSPDSSSMSSNVSLTEIQMKIELVSSNERFVYANSAHTHFVCHFHLHVRFLECSHIAGYLLGLHEFIHFTHSLRSGCQCTTQCDIRTHRFILEANTRYFAVCRICAILLFSNGNQLFS